jgi:hypothetical protein
LEETADENMVQPTTVEKTDPTIIVRKSRVDLEKEAKPIRGHLIRWRGAEIMVTEDIEDYVNTRQSGCQGLCKDELDIAVAVVVAMDGVLEDYDVVTFRDVNEKMTGWQRIPIRGGRGIVIVDNIDKVAATNYCMAVCCKEFAVWLM